MASATTPSPEAGPVAPAPEVTRKAVVASSFGNAMEWYDFSVYAFFATFISANFFRGADADTALIETFVLFGAGFVARPLGSIVLGLMGDRRGRKPALLVSLFTMAAGVLVIGATPSAAVIGLAAPVLLLVGRLLQGFSAGGELGSAASFLVENAPAGRRSGYAAWLQASMGISNLLAAVAGLAVTTFFPESVVTAWAWRLPFFFGLLLIPVGLYIRAQLPETTDFREEQRASTRETLAVLFRENGTVLLAGFGFSILWNVAVYAFVIFGPTYYRVTDGLHFTSQQTFLASLVGNVFLVLGCVAAGRLADRVGRARMLAGGAVSLLVLPVLGLLLLHAVPTVPVMLVVHSVLCLSVAAFVGVAPSTLPQAFPAAARSTGVSLSYNVAAIGFAGFTPAILSWADRSLTVYAPALLVGASALVALACLPALMRHVARVEADAVRLHR